MAATCSQSSTIARSAAGAFGGSDGRAPCRHTFTAIFAGSKPLAPLLAWNHWKGSSQRDSSIFKANAVVTHSQGTSPESISPSTTPKEYTSAAAV